MDTRIQTTIKGFEEQEAKTLAACVHGLIQAIQRGDSSLDLRRLSRIEIARDFSMALADISTEFDRPGATLFTDEAYARAVAKVLMFESDTDFQFILVLDATLAYKAKEAIDRENEELLMEAAHFLHHELSHVHDSSQRVDTNPHVQLKFAYTGKASKIRSLAHRCWAEYYANRRSASTASDGQVKELARQFRNATRRAPWMISRTIRRYRYHDVDLEFVIECFERHGHFLILSASYLLGYLHGKGQALAEIDVRVAAKTEASDFAPIWRALQGALQKMFESYPEAWKDLSVYDELSVVVEEFHELCGLHYKDQPDGTLYLSLPFSPKDR